MMEIEEVKWDETPPLFNDRPRTLTIYFYSGDSCPHGLRIGKGFHEWKTDTALEIYDGNFLLDNEHRNGFYKWKTDNGDAAYEGSMYCNSMEGYGQYSYPDGSVFEGLYKNNNRFGPGIFTDPDGKQSVGFWRGKKIIKLIIKVEAGVPSLVSTPKGEKKLLAFRKLVPVNKELVEKVQEILKKMNVGSHTLERPSEVYNEYAKDRRSIYFNRPLYDGIFFAPYDGDAPIRLRAKSPTSTASPPRDATYGMKDDKLSVSSSVESEDFKRRPKRGAHVRGLGKKEKTDSGWSDDSGRAKNASDHSSNTSAQNDSHDLPEGQLQKAQNLVAWNNSNVFQEMLSYSFKHRHGENRVDYNIANIMRNKRQKFRGPGAHEALCVRFLKKCFAGDHCRVDDYIAFKGIDPNVSDCKGNTGLMIAAANDEHEVINVLLNRGADINSINNEGFTPVTMAITRYYTTEHEVKMWEKEFLKNKRERKIDKAIMWRYPSTCGGDQASASKKSKLEDAASRKSRSIRTRSFRGSRDIPELGLRPPLPPAIARKMQVIRKTILQLLRRGADPNVSSLPMNPLVLAILSRDSEVVKYLLAAGMEPNSKMPEEDGAIPALILAVLRPPDEEMVKIVQYLLEYGADANVGLPITSEDLMVFKLGELPPEQRGQKSVLHILMTRDDGEQFNRFLCDALNLLILYDANLKALFLGHTPLSAAIVKGNAGMVECLLKTDKVDPNQKLAGNLGIPMTALMNMRFAQHLKLEPALKMIDLLVVHGSNPLETVQVGEDFCGNVIDFGHKQLEMFKKSHKKIKDKDKIINNYNTMLEHLSKRAHQLLIKKIRGILGEKMLSRVKKFQEMKSSEYLKAFGRKTERLTKTSSLQVPPDWLSPEEFPKIIELMKQFRDNQLTRAQLERILKELMPDLSDEKLQELLNYITGGPVESMPGELSDLEFDKGYRHSTDSWLDEIFGEDQAQPEWEEEEEIDEEWGEEEELLRRSTRRSSFPKGKSTDRRRSSSIELEGKKSSVPPTRASLRKIKKEERLRKLSKIRKEKEKKLKKKEKEKKERKKEEKERKKLKKDKGEKKGEYEEEGEGTRGRKKRKRDEDSESEDEREYGKKEKFKKDREDKKPRKPSGKGKKGDEEDEDKGEEDGDKLKDKERKKMRKSKGEDEDEKEEEPGRRESEKKRKGTIPKEEEEREKKTKEKEKKDGRKKRDEEDEEAEKAKKKERKPGEKREEEEEKEAKKKRESEGKGKRDQEEEKEGKKKRESEGKGKRDEEEEKEGKKKRESAGKGKRGEEGKDKGEKKGRESEKSVEGREEKEGKKKRESEGKGKRGEEEKDKGEKKRRESEKSVEGRGKDKGEKKRRESEKSVEGKRPSRKSGADKKSVSGADKKSVSGAETSDEDEKRRRRTRTESSESEPDMKVKKVLPLKEKLSLQEEESKDKKKKPFYKPPEVDIEVVKYDVCFGCLRTFPQGILQKCPKCKLVKFCSAQCYWNARENGTHKCTGDLFPYWGMEPPRPPQELSIAEDKIKAKDIGIKPYTGTDLDTYEIPYVVLRDGDLYYKLYEIPERKENYSLN